eukprot:scaffold1449_cov244-Pinguiococcus_pyrenoidosus.AAC.12
MSRTTGQRGLIFVTQWLADGSEQKRGNGGRRRKTEARTLQAQALLLLGRLSGDPVQVVAVVPEQDGVRGEDVRGRGGGIADGRFLLDVLDRPDAPPARQPFDGVLDACLKDLLRRLYLSDRFRDERADPLRRQALAPDVRPLPLSLDDLFGVDDLVRGVPVLLELSVHAELVSLDLDVLARDGVQRPGPDWNHLVGQELEDPREIGIALPNFPLPRGEVRGHEADVLLSDSHADTDCALVHADVPYPAGQHASVNAADQVQLGLGHEHNQGVLTAQIRRKHRSLLTLLHSNDDDARVPEALHEQQIRRLGELGVQIPGHDDNLDGLRGRLSGLRLEASLPERGAGGDLGCLPLKTRPSAGVDVEILDQLDDACLARSDLRVLRLPRPLAGPVPQPLAEVPIGESPPLRETAGVNSLRFPCFGQPVVGGLVTAPPFRLGGGKGLLQERALGRASCRLARQNADGVEAGEPAGLLAGIPAPERPGAVLGHDLELLFVRKRADQARAPRRERPQRLLGLGLVRRGRQELALPRGVLGGRAGDRTARLRPDGLRKVLHAAVAPQHDPALLVRLVEAASLLQEAGAHNVSGVVQRHALLRLRGIIAGAAHRLVRVQVRDGAALEIHRGRGVADVLRDYRGAVVGALQLVVDGAVLKGQVQARREDVVLDGLLLAILEQVQHALERPQPLVVGLQVRDAEVQHFGHSMALHGDQNPEAHIAARRRLGAHDCRHQAELVFIKKTYGAGVKHLQSGAQIQAKSSGGALLRAEDLHRSGQQHLRRRAHGPGLSRR